MDTEFQVQMWKSNKCGSVRNDELFNLHWDLVRALVFMLVSSDTKFYSRFLWSPPAPRQREITNSHRQVFKKILPLEREQGTYGVFWQFRQTKFWLKWKTGIKMEDRCFTHICVWNHVRVVGLATQKSITELLILAWLRMLEKVLLMHFWKQQICVFRKK